MPPALVTFLFMTFLSYDYESLKNKIKKISKVKANLLHWLNCFFSWLKYLDHYEKDGKALFYNKKGY